MKAVCLFLILGIHALNCVAQTASAPLQNPAGSSALENGTGRLEDRIESTAAAYPRFEGSNAPSASWPQNAVNVAVAEDSDLPFGMSPRLHYGASGDGDPPRYPSNDQPHAEDAAAPSNLAVQPVEPSHTNTKIRWKPAIQEALLATGIWHTFNLWTEAGTRDALNGPWLKDYLRSVGELRGWSDSDEFMAPYASHPIGGSIFGYILRQNDPKYRDVQWGDGRDYFISVLRSMAWTAVWHTQWKIGPISEASIGNVMLHASPGFITLVDTPTLGAVTMIGEDAADRYVIMGLESRTANRALILLARCFLNPGRSFANVMAFKFPWTRETRSGIFGDNYLVRKQLVEEYKNGSGQKPFEFARRPSDSSDADPGHIYPKVGSIELAAYPNFERFSDGQNCIGGGGSGAARISPTLQIVAEVNGCLVMGMPAYNESGDSLFYGAGPRWTPLASHRVSPFAEILFGGRKVTYEVDDLALKKMLLNEWNDGNGTLPHYPKRSDWSTEVSSNGASLATGGGMDVVITRPFTWRVINVEYTHSWMQGVEMIHPQNGIRITTEAVLRIGTW
jgi:hypothetical protein